MPSASRHRSHRSNAGHTSESPALSSVSPATPSVLIYPSKAKDASALTPTEALLKVARHSSCSDDCGCKGFRPERGAEVSAGSIQSKSTEARERDAQQQWKSCGTCGHALAAHGDVDKDDDEERIRRIKVAVRLDELLEDKKKLLAWDYDDQDQASLRRQLASLQAEDGEQSPPMSKKRRLAVEDDSRASSSSPSTPSPLEVSHPTQSSKGPPLPPEEAAEQARDNAAQQEPEEPSATAERKDSAAASLAAASVPPVSAVAAGIAVDPTEDLAPTQPQRERPAVVEERTGLIQFRVVTNRNLTKTAPADLVILTGLKNIFQRQLPKMPREYITRLVLDRNHVSMAIVKRGLQVVGGITYRPFNKRRFAEIVFCAIDSSQQVKGYGQHLMNHLKDYVKESSDVMHFLTYADNYAIGYFKKQGFTKEISLPRSVWVGYIKDYEGGTLMQCSMVPRVQYLSVHEMLAAQKEMVLSRIRAISQSHIVHPGLAVFRDKDASADPETGFKVAPADVPGLASAGWTPEMDVMARRPKRGPHHSLMRSILVELQNHAASWPFMAPVNGDEVPDYYSVIQSPMDLATMESKLLNNQYDEGGVDAMIADSQLIFDNCRAYNPRNSPYAKCADKLEKFLKENLPMWKQSAGLVI